MMIVQSERFSAWETLKENKKKKLRKKLAKENSITTLSRNDRE